MAVVALVAVSLVGIPLGIGLFLALAPLYFVGYVTAAFLLGRLLIKVPRSRIGAAPIGLLILQVISLIPFLGPLMWVVATVIGLGALVVAAGGPTARQRPHPSSRPDLTTSAAAHAASPSRTRISSRSSRIRSSVIAREARMKSRMRLSSARGTSLSMASPRSLSGR